jgi:hypothetical protein
MTEKRSVYVVQPRDGNEPEIIATFEAAGCVVERIHEIGDLVVELYQFTVLVEVKTPTGKYTKKQKEIRKRLKNIETVRTVEDALAVIEKYRRWHEIIAVLSAPIGCLGESR